MMAGGGGRIPSRPSRRDTDGTLSSIADEDMDVVDGRGATAVGGPQRRGGAGGTTAGDTILEEEGGYSAFSGTGTILEEEDSLGGGSMRHGRSAATGVGYTSTFEDVEEEGGSSELTASQPVQYVPKVKGAPIPASTSALQAMMLEEQESMTRRLQEEVGLSVLMVLSLWWIPCHCTLPTCNSNCICIPVGWASRAEAGRAKSRDGRKAGTAQAPGRGRR